MFNTNFLCLLCQLSSKQLKMWKNITLLILLLYQIWVPSPKNGWTQAKNNEFVESELENWAKMSSTTIKVGSNDKNRKIDWFKLKEIIIDTIQGDQFLYIFFKFNYKFGSWLLQCFFLDFSISLSHYLLLLLYPLPLSFLPSTCRPNGWCWYLSYQHLPEVFV